MDLLDRVLARLMFAPPDFMDDWKGSWPEWKWKWKKMTCLRSWLEGRREREGAEGLWRVHDGLYDLSSWADRHPGGSQWITLNKGLDITEAFESHHVSEEAERKLAQFLVRPATQPRCSPFTFAQDGFYRTLKSSVRQHLKQHPAKHLSHHSSLLTDLLLGSSLGAACVSVQLPYPASIFLAMASGFLLTLLTICSHNYFHQRDNFRMYFFNLCGLSYRDWRISHAMSHHLYPNTRYDLEMFLAMPYLQYFPWKHKTITSRFLSWLYCPIVFILLFHISWLRRMQTWTDGWHELIPLVYPVMMVATGAPLWTAFLLWQVVILTSSFFFGLIGTTAAHHHPDIFHDGDKPRWGVDWGLHQLDAVRDRRELKGKLPLVMTLFGDHSLHHLFPTLDHSVLNQLYPLLERTCTEFSIRFPMVSYWQLVLGQFTQLSRVEPRG